MSLATTVFCAFSSMVLAQNPILLQKPFTTIEAIHFEGIRMVAPRDQIVTLRFEPDQLVLRSNRTYFKVLLYAQLKSVEYSYSTTPGRWSRQRGADRKHWLRMTAEKEAFILQLDEKNHESILLKFEEWAHVQVKPVGEVSEPTAQS